MFGVAKIDLDDLGALRFQGAGGLLHGLVHGGVVGVVERVGGDADPLRAGLVGRFIEGGEGVADFSG